MKLKTLDDFAVALNEPNLSVAKKAELMRKLESFAKKHHISEQEVARVKSGAGIAVDMSAVKETQDVPSNQSSQINKSGKQKKTKANTGKTHKHHNSTIKFYTELGEQFIGNGALDKDLVEQPDQLCIGFRNIFSPNSKRVCYEVVDYPIYLDRELFLLMRKHVEGYGVALNFLVRSKQFKIDWNSRMMKVNRRHAQEYTENYDYSLNNFSTTEDIENADASRRMSASYGYYTSIEQRNQTLVSSEISLELWQTIDDEVAIQTFRLAQKKLKDFCALHRIKLKEIKFDLYEYLKTHAPVSGMQHKETPFSYTRVLSDEIIARLPGYTGGSIGRSGVLMGRDVMTNKLVYKDFIRSGGEAENVMVLAESGSGKSYYIKFLNFMMLANGFDVVVLDIDAEYVHQTTNVDGIVISFNKSYFDTMEISKPTGDLTLDSQLLNDSRTATATVFSCLSDLDRGMTANERKVFTAAYNRLYDEHNILISDMSTWGRSKELDYHMLYEKIVEFQEEEEARKIEVPAKDVKLFVAKLSTFFDPEGLHSYLFKSKISSNDIFQRKGNQPMMIDIALNLQKNATKGEELIGQTVKQLTASYLTMLIANRNKHDGRFTTEIIEEYQRYAHQPDVSDMILNKVTGNRKRNMNTVLITNSPLELLNSKDASAYSVIENINNYVVGALKPRTIKLVCETFNLDNCENLISKISKNQLYKHNFLLKLNNREVTIVKAEVPPKLSKSKIFTTRDTKLNRVDKAKESLTWEDKADKSAEVNVQKVFKGRRGV